MRVEGRLTAEGPHRPLASSCPLGAGSPLRDVGQGLWHRGDTSLHSRWELTSYHGAHQMPRMAGTSLVSNGNYTGSTLPATAAGLCVPPCTHLPAFKCPKSHYPRRKPDCIQHRP